MHRPTIRPRRLLLALLGVTVAPAPVSRAATVWRRGVLLAIVLLGATVEPAAAERAAMFLGSTARDVDRPALVAIARAEAQAAGWAVTEPPLGAGALADLLTCVGKGQASDCIPGHLDDNDVDRGIVISVGLQTSKNKRSWVVNGWVFRRAGDLLITDRRYCDGCKADRLGDTVRELTATLVREARARAKPTLIVARSRPTGARVFVDDQAVGVAELEVPVYAGIHMVRFELEAHLPELREIAIGDGEAVTVEVTLAPVVAPAPPPPAVEPPPPARRAPSRRLPMALVGTGVATLVAGAVVLALDEDPIQDGSQVPTYTDTVRPAVGLFAAGAAVTGLGVYLMIRARAHPATDEARPTPVVGLAPGGGWLGVAGRF